MSPTRAEALNPPEFRSCITQVLGADGDLAGTGFLIGRALVLTCAHVVDSAGKAPGDPIDVRFLQSDGAGTERVAAVVRADLHDPIDDLAVLELPSPAPAAARVAPLGGIVWSNSRQQLTGIGVPSIVPTELIITAGVAGFTGDLFERSLRLQLDAHVEPGCSGGPLFDVETGAAVAVIVSKLGEDRAFGIPVQRLAGVLTQAWLGRLEDEALAELHGLIEGALLPGCAWSPARLAQAPIDPRERHALTRALRPFVADEWRRHLLLSRLPSDAVRRAAQTARAAAGGTITPDVWAHSIIHTMQEGIERLAAAAVYAAGPSAARELAAHAAAAVGRKHTQVDVYEWMGKACRLQEKGAIPAASVREAARRAAGGRSVPCDASLPVERQIACLVNHLADCQPAKDSALPVDRLLHALARTDDRSEEEVRETPGFIFTVRLEQKHDGRYALFAWGRTDDPKDRATRFIGGELLRSLEEVKQRVDAARVTFETKHSIPDGRLLVEFVLPQDLAFEPVENWPAHVASRTVSLGRHCMVVVRSWERACGGALRQREGTLRDKWLRHHQEPCLHHAETTDDEALFTALTEENTTGALIPILVLPPDSCDTRPQVLRLCLAAGIPIALWTRIPRGCDAAQLSEFVPGNEHHRELPLWVKNCRRRSAGATVDTPMLTLLWDDPNRPPPDPSSRKSSPKKRIPG